MKKARDSRKPCATGHALAIARWEENHKSWLEGDYFGLRSRRTDLQDLIGDGGTLWIIVSRQAKGHRIYSLTFRLEECRRHDYDEDGLFGKYGVVGDPNRSTLYASNDARLLLLSLRFDPPLPIDDEKDRLSVVGQSIQRPRCLNTADVKLLEDFGAEVDRWSVFVSYEHTDADERIATRLSKTLQREGISVFRDKEALRAGDEWWPALKRAIGRARLLVVVIGRTTHDSDWVKREVQHAIRGGVNVIPVLAGGTLDHWTNLGLNDWQALTYGRERWSELVGQVVAATHRASLGSH